MAKCPECTPGAPEWLATFGDLMSLLVCFFVLLISFSIQDKQKLQVVAGSMRDAFGVDNIARKAGMIEVEGAPVREFVKSVRTMEDEKKDSDYDSVDNSEHSKQGPEANTYDTERADVSKPNHFALAAASLRQAFGEMPDILESSQNVLMQETKEGLNIQLVDQDGRSMFPQGSAEPYERTRRVLEAMAPVLRGMPNRIAITGHTDANRLYGQPDYTLWDLSSDRARAVRRVLAANGIGNDRFHSVAGRADSEPLYPEDPFLAANRRVSILLMNEAPPVPPELKP